MNHIRGLLLAIILLGIVDAAYLTFVHYVPAALLCPETGPISCETVLNSSYSEILGIPIAFGGLLWFAFEALLFWRKGHNEHFRYVGALAGVGAVAYSLAGMHVIGKICIYCSLLDVLIAATALLSVFGASGHAA